MSIPSRPIRRDTRVFISAVTRELGSVRKLVKKGLEDNDYHAVEQDNFPPDYRELTEKLRERIASCDAMVHIAGHCYGAEPILRPDDAPRRSYTQLEYDIAVDLGKPVYVFLTGAEFPTDPHEPEPPELRELQAAHRQRLTSTGKDYNPTASVEQLDQKIRSLQLKVERLGKELQQVDQTVAVHGGRLRRWLVATAVLGLVGLGGLGYVGWRQQVEQRAQEQEREKQERERIAAAAARKEAQTIQQVQQEFAERFLQQLLTDKQVTAEDARQRALKELPALVKLPLAEIQSLIDRKIAPRATEASLTPLERARAALAKGNYDEVFQAADQQKQQGRELAMLEGTAALAQFRTTPKPEWIARALAAFQRAMALFDPNSASEWEAWTDAAVSAASVSHDLARYSGTEPLLRDCLRLREAHIGPNSPGVAVVLNNLALLLQATNRMAEAEPLIRRALAIDEKSYGPDHPAIAIRLNNLAQLLQATNRMAEAEPLMRRALAIDEKSYGPDHPKVAIDLNSLAMLLQDTNRVAEAEPLMARVVRIFSQFQRSTGHEHLHLRDAVENYRQLLSILKLSEHEIAARIKAAREGTDKLPLIVPEVERLLGPAKPVADVLTSLDRQYKEQGKPAVYFLKPDEPIAPHLDELLQPNGDRLNAQGVVAFREGAHADAVVLYEAALELMADQPAQAPKKLIARMNRAAAMRELGLVEQARDELSRLLPELDQIQGADSFMKGRARYQLALCLWRLGDRAEAQRSADESLAAYDGAPKEKPVDPVLRWQSEELLVVLKDGKAPRRSPRSTHPPRSRLPAPAIEPARR